MNTPEDCAWAQAVLLGEAPFPVGDQSALEAAIRSCPDCAALADSLNEIDALAASLPELVVPKALSRRTLEMVQAEMKTGAAPISLAPPARRSRRRPMLWLAGGLSMAAAAMLAVQPGEPEPAPVDRLVARGSATALPTVSLKVAISDGQELQRHRSDQTYPAGTRVQFRVGLDQAADVALVRVGSDSVDIVTRTSLEHGDHDLQIGTSPLAWEVETGEGNAHFVILAGPQGSMPDDLTAVIEDGSEIVDASGPCAHITALACDERLLRVSP
jgi:hypothetical protein